MKVYRAIGLMSGTSLDGVDVALIETDGEGLIRRLGFATYPYDGPAREVIRGALGKKTDEAASAVVTDRHIQALRQFMKAFPAAKTAELIGFHGQTIYHNPAQGMTVQVGDAAALARETGKDVVSDFRSADVKAGGQGAPFLPLYHAALAAGLKKPVAILNIGGVANVTYIGDGEILAFDCGPGNALIDDFMKKRTGKNFDEGGAMARGGDRWMAHPFFAKLPPKSLDRDAWKVGGIEGLSDANGAATLAAFTVSAIARGADHLPAAPKRWYVTGGGRHNKAIIRGLRKHLGFFAVSPVERAGWNGDAMEAEGFAYLAVRSLLGLPLSLPTTTGVPKPLSGGVYTRA
jgi:anhydro-N-acetylmuramic acid kinase